jgi:CRP-like cAMP-binding protein
VYRLPHHRTLRMYEYDDTPHRRNRLLVALPAAEFARLVPHLEIVPLQTRNVLVDARHPITHLWFPHTGVVCLMAVLRDGVIETATIGSEGCVGFEVVHGGEAAGYRALVQLAGMASRLSLGSLLSAWRPGTTFHDILLRYTGALIVQALQSVACNGLHNVRQRCARYLLMAHDRARADRLDLTQEFLAEMLGIRRPSVTIVARTLQTVGLIRCSRGFITIIDRRGLEGVACECYGVVRQALEAWLPARRSE